MRIRSAALVTALVLALLAVPPTAAVAGAAMRIGLLAPDEEPRFSDIASSLRRGLREHGYREEAVEVLEGRVPRGDDAVARATVERFGQQRVAVVFAVGSVLARLARAVAPAVPIVFVTPGDPVAAGLVASLARPGGNMTGLTFEYPELSGKRLELLREILPRTRRVLVLYDPRDASPRQGVAAAREAAVRLGLSLVEHPVQSEEDVVRARAGLDGVDAVLGVAGGVTSHHYAATIRAANARRLPTIFHSRTESTRDALLTYGASDVDTARQAARLIDRVLKGANAGDLPVERPLTVSLVINRKTASRLGLTIPPSLLLRADHLID